MVQNSDVVKYKLTNDPVIFNVLDANTVVLTTIGSFEKVEKTDVDKKPWFIDILWFGKKRMMGGNYSICIIRGNSQKIIALMDINLE